MGFGEIAAILLATLPAILLGVALLVLWKIPANPGSLILTNKGLYHNGKWGAIHVRLNDMCPPKTDRRMLGVSLPLDDVVKFASWHRRCAMGLPRHSLFNLKFRLRCKQPST